MKLTGKFVAPRLNLARYREVLKKHLHEAIAQALMEWLMATVINKVPVWSGASAATFRAVANYIRYTIPIVPVAAIGSREAQGEVQSAGQLDAGDTKPGRFVFTYQTTLPWLLVNEYYDATQWGFHLKKPGPYHFQQAGAAAFWQFARGVRLPNPFMSLQGTSIQVG